MHIFELIHKVQTKSRLNKNEIFWLVDKFTKDEIPDYQMSAWLASVFINHLSEEETSWLTQALSESGQQLKWSAATVDKHSTGGVGDKTSLILAPIVASLGIKVPMMAGRGLGHTGGTVDKLESLKFKTDLEAAHFKNLVETNGICIMGQSEDFCPADKRLYALRDATHTVANIPLICSSIMSKKIAEGLNGLVLDVKFGTGAFMPTIADSKLLAEKLIRIGEANHIKTFAVLSSMNQPLGRYIGNKLEIIECLEILKSPEEVFAIYEDNILLSLLLAALMLQSLNPQTKLEKNFTIVYDQLMSGRAFTKFLDMVHAQDGHLLDFYENGETSFLSPLKPRMHAKKITVTSEQDGYMNYVNIKTLGLAAVSLGAGRLTKTDQIDSEVGFYCYKKQNDSVSKSEALFDIYYNNEIKLSSALEQLKASFEVQSTSLLTKESLVSEILSFDGQSYKNIHLKTKYFEV